MLKWTKRLFFAFFAMGLLGCIALTAIYFHVKNDLPSVEMIKEIKLQVPLKIYSVDGELISQYGEKRRIPLTIDEVPEHLKEAFIATEDSRFYSHFGIDPIGIARAVVVVITSRSKRQGASTITQQVAKNIYLTREKTFTRKIREMFLAIQIEQVLTKDEILMLYLNKISLGQRSYGIGAAARVYYDKTVSELTLAQIAVLAGLPKAPSRNNPEYSPENARNRRHVVLLRMLDEEYITKAEFDEANNAPITGKRHGAKIELSAQYAAAYALKSPATELALETILASEKESCQTIASQKVIDSCLEAKNKLNPRDLIYTEGITIYTTINKRAQKAANKAVINNVLAYDQRHGFREPKIQLWTMPEDKWEVKAILKELKKHPVLSGLVPAVVVDVKDKSVDVIAKDSKEEVQTIEWDGLKWARKFVSDTRQGSAPKSAKHILKTGQQIWIQRVAKIPAKGEEVILDENGEPKKIVKLSQVPDVGSAFISLSPHDGAIQAMVGGFSFVQSKFNRVTQAKRQLGSNIKPFIYSAALDNGYTLATLVNDTPFNRTIGDSAWRPKNSPAVYEGPLRLRRGLGQSKNVVSVRLVEKLGISKIIEQLEKFGFDKANIPKGMSIALGSPSSTPLKVATGFAIINNGGYKVEPYIVERIEDLNGDIIYQAEPNVVCEGPYKVNCENIPPERIAKSTISLETSFLTRELLSTAIWGGGDWRAKTGWNGTGWRAGRAIKRHDMGGKTGTTNDSKDAWFSGFVGNVVATSWVGFDNFNRGLGRTTKNKNLEAPQTAGGEFGGSTALPAWNSYMLETAMDQPIRENGKPRSISKARIDRKTGLLTDKTGATTLYEYFRSGTVPTEYADEPDEYEEIKSVTEGDSTSPEETVSEDSLF